jgi:hypothetical protein
VASAVYLLAFMCARCLDGTYQPGALYAPPASAGASSPSPPPLPPSFALSEAASDGWEASGEASPATSASAVVAHEALREVRRCLLRALRDQRFGASFPPGASLYAPPPSSARDFEPWGADGPPGLDLAAGPLNGFIGAAQLLAMASVIKRRILNLSPNPVGFFFNADDALKPFSVTNALFRRFT